MECPKCGQQQDDANKECVRCGLIFGLYRPINYDKILDRQGPEQADKPPLPKRIFEYMFYAKEKIEPAFLIGRALVFILLFIWSLKFLSSSIESNYVGRSFMHMVNLPFHEAGHLFFRPFGRVLHSLGGSLGQLIMPLVCTLVLLIKTRDTFGASIALWWTGESVLDMAPYIADARSLNLQLLGGNTGASAPYGFHDWNFVLNELDLLRHDKLIAGLASTGGKFIMSLSLIWGLTVLVRQLRNLKRTSS